MSKKKIKDINELKEENKILWKHNKQRAEEIKKLHTYGDNYKKDYHDMKDERDELRKRIVTLESSYNELIMTVEKKFEGETRHETALRYIQSAELGGEVGKNDNKTTS